jgi:hypothetical protein
LSRAIKVQAGHRCAIPTRRGTSALEIAHIEPRAKGGADSFENLILLCAVCHTRYDTGDIDLIAMRQYKLDLALLNGRYGSLERRVLQWFAENDRDGTVQLDATSELLVSFLVRDGLLEVTDKSHGISVWVGGKFAESRPS